MALNQSGLLFVPAGWQRATAVRWLKRVHAWTGFWGAALFLLLGTSGFLLNHRNTLKIDTGEPQEVSTMRIAVPKGTIADEKALGIWAKNALGLAGSPKPPRKEEAGKKQFLGKAFVEPPLWSQQFTQPNGRVTIDYVPGSPNVTVRHDSNSPLTFIKNLHKGTGVGVAWVLFLDTIAGALIAMALTGFLLWTRLHGGRLLAAAIAGTSTGLAIWAVWPYLL